MKFLIIGGGLNNKGAQAMLYIAIDQIYKRFKNCTIYVEGIPSNSNLKVEAVKFDLTECNFLLNIYNKILIVFEIILKKLLGKNGVSVESLIQVKELLKSIDVIIDISGYCLSSQNNKRINMQYLRRIQVAKKFGILYYALPQSYGPFDYKSNKSKLLNMIKKILAYPNIIFAREKGGYELLVEGLGLTNVRKSFDMVLINKGIDIDSVFLDKPKSKIFTFEGNNVLIIPNKQVESRIGSNVLLQYYITVIDYLIDNKYNVYITYHTNSDYSICKKIIHIYTDDIRVKFLDKEFSSIDLFHLIQNFDFCVASRYHSIIHAFKSGVPCIVLEWAYKYTALLESMLQSDYIIKLSDANDKEKVLYVTMLMNKRWKYEKTIIMKKLQLMRKDDIFDILEDDIKTVIQDL